MYDLEKEMAWAIKGFLDNYTDDVEEISRIEKQFYILSGTAFYATIDIFPNDWMSVGEATQIWGLGSTTVRSAIKRKQFNDGEYRKSGNVWLIRRSAMARVYGTPDKNEEKAIEED